MELGYGLFLDRETLESKFVVVDSMVHLSSPMISRFPVSMQVQSPEKRTFDSNQLKLEVPGAVVKVLYSEPRLLTSYTRVDMSQCLPPSQALAGHPTLSNSAVMARPYTVAPHLHYFNVPLTDFTSARPEFDSFGVGGYIFSGGSTPRVLLLQRALTDSMPGCWEGPGGSYEPEIDGTLLDGVAREVLEETGLHVSHVADLVAVASWTHTRRNGSKFRIAKYSFIVEVQESVRRAAEPVPWEQIPVQLMEGEHQAFDWATEEDVRLSLQSGGKYQLPLTSTGHQAPSILRSFELYRELQSKI